MNRPSPEQVVREVTELLTRPVQWAPMNAPDMAERGGIAYTGTTDKGWAFIVVSFPAEDPPGSRGYDGTATHASTVTILRLPRALAERAFKLAEAACPKT